MEKYISVRELGENLGIGRSKAYELMKFPGFPSVRIGKRIIVSETTLRDWIERGGTEPKDSRSA